MNEFYVGQLVLFLKSCRICRIVEFLEDDMVDLEIVDSGKRIIGTLKGIESL